MSSGAPATYYDGVTSKPWDALVTVREPSTLEVEILGDGTQVHRFQWPLEHKGMTWERNGGNMLRLSFGDHPRKVLVIRDALFIKSFALRMRYSGRQGVYDRTLATARSGPVLFFAGVLALLVAAYLWILPWAAEGIAMAMPRSLDVQLGDGMYSSMSSTLNIDEERSKVLQQFGDKLQLCPSYTPRYHVVNDAQVNAFAMPGGHIVVFTGLLEKMEEPEELVALLGHEATHVEERHSTRMIMRNLGSYMFISLLLGDVSAVVTVAAQNADNIRNMGYSRSLETDADQVGQERMKANGVDPNGMVGLLELLEAEAQEMPDEISFLSSHPLTKDRISNAKKKAAALGPTPAMDPELKLLFERLVAGN